MNNNNSDYFFINDQNCHNVYNIYNNNDDAFLFDSTTTDSTAYNLQQDIYNCGYLLQQQLCQLDSNKVSDGLVYDYTLLNDNFLYECTAQSIFPNTNVSLSSSYNELINESFLQDDNFSIATVSDLNNMSNSHAITPLSTPSPQLSDLNSNYNNHTQFIQPLFQTDFLFAPIEDKVNDSKKGRCSADTEKKHICPICNHR